MRSRRVSGKPKPLRATAPRDRFAARWFGGDDALDHQAELTRRTNTPVSMQLEVGQKTHKTIIYGTIYVSSIWQKNVIYEIIPSISQR
jgi:hypothetical protein